MNPKLKIAYYAPLKPPDHPIPSGDRQMSRMLLNALLRAGYDAFLASRLISYSKRHAAEHMEARIAAAREEADRLVDSWKKEDKQPDLWFCYHPYDKSPDWLGMEICQRLNIPMITAEPCKTGQGPNGEWIPWRAEAQRGIAMANMNIVMTPADFEYVSTFIEPEKIALMDPFIDQDLLVETPIEEDPWPDEPDIVRLLTVGMMRPGAKLDSYKVLASALAKLENQNWFLVIAGGGPGRDMVEAEFDPSVKNRIHFAGEVEAGTAIGLMEKADVLAWPGCREAYGMVYLEAGSRGVPAAALDNMGVPLVVVDGKTGLLADPENPGDYARILDRLIADKVLREKLGKGAKTFVSEERSGQMAAKRLSQIIERVMAKAGAPS
ncbi:MAG: glycosyltransferase family 4 protein [Rhizobiaceae bacterium]